MIIQYYKSQNIKKLKLHKVYTVQVDKTALSYNDDKCLIMYDNIHTLTHGHSKINLCLNSKIIILKKIANTL